LTTPNSDDGAVRFELRGPSIESPTAAHASFQLQLDTVSATVWQVLVVGNINAGGLLAFQVPDVSAATSWSAKIIEVADRQNSVRSSLVGYSLTVY
jgi:hypothetical protein